MACGVWYNPHENLGQRWRNVHQLRIESGRIWRGAFILTVAALFVKILSAVYRMPYQNFAGDVGFYVYQQVYPFYALAVALGGTGFPIVISKYIAESGRNKGIGEEATVRRHARIALFFLCGLIFVVLVLGAEPLTEVMGDQHLAPLLRTAAWVYLFVPFSAVLRGGFQGKDENMVPTAVSQIGEQVVRVSLIIGSSWFLFLHHGGAYQFGEAAITGSAIAPAASLLILILFIRKGTNRDVQEVPVNRSINWRLIGSLLLGGSVFSILALPLVLFQLVDSLSVIRLLHHAQIAEPREAKGIYDRAYLLTQFGMIAAASLTASIVPGLAKLAARRKVQEIRRQATLALKISLAFGLAAACGLAAISGPVNIMLFRNDRGAVTFAIIAFTLLTLSVILTTSGMFEAAGHPVLPFLFLCLGAAVKLILNICLIPHFSIAGAALATCLATLLTAGLNSFALLRMRLINRIPTAALLKLAAASGVMLTAVYLFGRSHLPFGGSSRLAETATALVGAAGGAVLFIALLILLRYFTPNDIARLPLTGKLGMRRPSDL